MSKTSALGLSQRQLQVGEQVRRSLSEILQRWDFYDTSLTSISITEVRMSPDLKWATVFIMPLGGENQEAHLETLGKLAPQLQKVLGKTMRTKFTPRLRFTLDHSFDYASRIQHILKQSEEV